MHKLGTQFQTLDSTAMVVRTVTMAKAGGVTGVSLIQVQPLLVVALPTVGAIFFYGTGAVLGNNFGGRLCNSIGYTLSLPMRGIEAVYNVYAAPFINTTLGLPTILNVTSQLQQGPGLNMTQALKFIDQQNKTSLIIRGKNFLINLLKS